VAQYRRIWMALALVCGIAAAPARADNEVIPAANDPAWSLCATGAAQVESELGMPAYLLKAVALTETGYGVPGRRGIAAWPWTVHDGETGHYFATKEAAVEFVREIRTDGKRSIDVGCMQVNLRHHPRAFTSVAAGFDPVVNIRYAAQFLRQLKESASSWEEAVARYHSFNPVDNYAGRVLSFWQRERLQASLTPVTPQMAPLLAANDRARLVLASAETGVRRIAGSPAAIRVPAVADTSPATRVLAWPK